MTGTSLVAAPAVYIVGFAPSWPLTPWEVPNAHYWGMNALHKVAPDKPWTAWFQLHDIERAHPNDAREHLEWLAQCNVPVFMWEEHIPKYGLPNAVPYPRQAVLKFFDTEYFTNTVSWMIALAIYQQYKKIGVYGVDMAQDEEYCVSPSSLVLTSDLNWTPASSIQVGDELIGFDECVDVGSRRHFRGATVEAVQELIQPCYQLEMEDGTKLVSSELHRWFTNQKKHPWKTTLELREPSEVWAHYLCKALDVWDFDSSWGSGFLSAAFDGEGALVVQKDTLNGLQYSQNPNAMAERVKYELSARNYQWSEYDTPSRGTKDIRLLGGKVEALRLLGSTRPPRLLGRFHTEQMGQVNKRPVRVLSKTYLGEQPVIGIQTSTGTFLVDGFMSHNSHQRPSVEFFLGWAAGAGIDLDVPITSDLLKSAHLYGFNDDGGVFRTKLVSRLAELNQRKMEMTAQRDQAQQIILQIMGAEEDVAYILRAWTQPTERLTNG